MKKLNLFTLVLLVAAAFAMTGCHTTQHCGGCSCKSSCSASAKKCGDKCGGAKASSCSASTKECGGG